MQPLHCRVQESPVQAQACGSFKLELTRLEDVLLG